MRASVSLFVSWLAVFVEEHVAADGECAVMLVLIFRLISKLGPWNDPTSWQLVAGLGHSVFTPKVVVSLSSGLPYSATLRNGRRSPNPNGVMAQSRV